MSECGVAGQFLVPKLPLAVGGSSCCVTSSLALGDGGVGGGVGCAAF